MYRNAIYDNRSKTIKLFTWGDDGKRIQVETSFNPYLYIEAQDGNNTSIYGTRVKKRVFQTSYDRNRFVKDSGIKRVFENLPAEQQFLLDMFWKENEKPEFSQYPLKICYIDIETYSPASGGFPDVDNPTHPVNAITCYDSFSKKFNTFGTKPFTGDNKNVKYTFCKTESELFEKFLQYIEKDYPDILSGWSSEVFDIPYIINRCDRVLGEGEVKRLSPLGNIYSRDVKGKFGRDQKRYYIDGISCIDYLEIYRRFCLKLRESYKLDAIAELELGERKVDYGDVDLATLADTDWDKFIVYNIQDVNLLVKLEEKLQYISLLRMLAYVGLTTLERAMGTISTVNGALTIRARQRNEILSTFVRSHKEGINPGAFVAPPKKGFQENIVSFDANSLYPNVMISLNLSPETKVGTFEKTDKGVVIHHVSGKSVELTNQKFDMFIKQEQLSVSKAKVLFTQKKKGIVPEFLQYYYDERVKIQRLLEDNEVKLNTLKKSAPEYKATKFEVERLNTKQMVIKVLINATYGYMGNKQAPLGDDDIASSVTLTGQSVIKQSNILVREFIKTKIPDIQEHELENCIIYNDTDSAYLTIKPFVRRGLVKFRDGEKIHQETYDIIAELDKYINNGVNEWSKKYLRSIDSRFIFKREAIADSGVFLQKKRYVMHVLDNKGIFVNKFKYVGVEVVRTTMPNAIKPYAKKIIETLITTQSITQTNKILNETFDVFKTLPVEEIAFVMGVNGYNKYASKCKGLETALKMPIHVKSAYLHNYILKDLKVRHEEIGSGDKTRYVYVKSNNKYKIDSIGFKYTYPKEFRDLFEIDYELMFEKILFNSIRRFYEGVDWRIRKPIDNVRNELDDLFGLD